MSLPRELLGMVRRLSEPELRRLLILARGLLLDSPGPAVELDDIPGMPAVTYRQQSVRCGKGCAACPHGPYWYAYWREDGRTRSLYIGAELAAGVRQLIDQAAAPGAGGN